MNRAKWWNSCISLETWLASIDVILVLALDLRSVCAEYGLETWLCAYWKKSYIGARHAAYLFWIWAQNMTCVYWKKIVHWHSTYSLSLLNMGLKYDWRQVKKFVYWRSTCSLLRWIWNANMTCANWRNSCIGTRPTTYLFWMWSRNLTRAKWLNSCIGARHAAYLCWIWFPNMTCGY